MGWGWASSCELRASPTWGRGLYAPPPAQCDLACRVEKITPCCGACAEMSSSSELESLPLLRREQPGRLHRCVEHSLPWTRGGEDTRHTAGARRTYSQYERVAIVTLYKRGRPRQTSSNFLLERRHPHALRRSGTSSSECRIMFLLEGRHPRAISRR